MKHFYPRKESGMVTFSSILFVLCIIVACIALLIIAPFIYYEKEHQLHDPKARPELNSHPQHSVTIYGHVDKGLKVTIAPSFVVQNTQDSRCQITTAWLEGATGNRQKFFPLHLKPNQDGNYSVTFPIDKLKKGYCDWALDSLWYFVKYKKISTIDGETTAFAGFQDNQSNRDKLKVNLLCIDNNTVIVCEPTNTKQKNEGVLFSIDTHKMNVNFINGIEKVKS